MMKKESFIMIYGRMDRDSRFPDFWKIDHILQHYYTVSGPDSLIFGEKVQVEKMEDGLIVLHLEDDDGRLLGTYTIKNVYEINVNRFTNNTANAAEAGA